MEAEVGRAYVFRWQDGELTGVATRISGRQRWVTLRTKTGSFSVPPEDVLREAAP